MERRLFLAVKVMRAEIATGSDVVDIVARIDRLPEDLTRQPQGSVVEPGTAEMAPGKDESVRSDVQTIKDVVLALTGGWGGWTRSFGRCGEMAKREPDRLRRGPARGPRMRDDE